MKAIAFVGILLVTSAAAARAEFYIGASATSTSSTFETAVDNFDSDELGWKAYGGYNFLKFIGAEVSYRDLGSHSEALNSGAVDLDLNVIDGSVRAYCGGRAHPFVAGSTPSGVWMTRLSVPSGL